jgi:glycosyltransferase involved in cell wall biosynthesis
VFRWIGGSSSEPALEALVNDAARLGLTERISPVGQVRRADRVLGGLDLFLSTSREDANPLVVLEAAANGCPVVCFSDSGGAADMALAGGATALPYLDLAAMATTVRDLSQAPAARRRELGQRGQALVQERNQVGVVGGRVVDALAAVSAPAV